MPCSSRSHPNRAAASSTCSRQEPGCNVNRVCEYLENDIGRFAVMKHLATLEAAGLVIAERSGRERRLWFDPTPIQWIHERWTTELSAYWAAR